MLDFDPIVSLLRGVSPGFKSDKNPLSISRLFADSDEKQRNQKLAALSICPKIYLFNLVSCLCYALNHVFDG